MRQSRTRKKVPRGAIVMASYAEPCDSNMFDSQATIVQRPNESGGGGCVDCHDFYEIHV